MTITLEMMPPLMFGGLVLAMLIGLRSRRSGSRSASSRSISASST